jgi:hypothetical protein
VLGVLVVTAVNQTVLDNKLMELVVVLEQKVVVVEVLAVLYKQEQPTLLIPILAVLVVLVLYCFIIRNYLCGL